MTNRFLSAFGALLLASAVASTATQVDPITGVWTGEIVPDSGKRFAVTLQLSFDGKSSVSGTISGLPVPADVKSGAFDRKTGALRLPLGPVGNSQVVITLDGAVAKGTAAGRAIDSTGEGTFRIARKT
jgi:hypothetical protein